MSRTNLGRDAGWFSAKIFQLLGKAPSVAAQTPIYLAKAPEVEAITGEYFEKNTIRKTKPETYDMVAARKLWDMSVKLIR
jgi:hypothetical protein